MTSLQINTLQAAGSQGGARSLLGPDWPSQTAPPEPEPSFEELLALSKRRFPAERFRHFPAVVVFAEHRTQLRDGRPVHYTPEALERIAANCNRRIQRSGNWAAVCIGHTEPQAGPKPLIGFAGPFRVQEQDGRAVITAELWIFQDQVEQLQYYPRPSPEVWIPTDGFQPDRIFLDPIAFLGADAPRLDLGMTFLYAAQADGGWQCELYAASFPAPGSVSAPDGPFDKKPSTAPAQTPPKDKSEQPNPDSKTLYQKGQTMLSPEDIQAILKAIEATDWYQWIRQQMAASQRPAESAASQPSAQAPPTPPTEGNKEQYQAPEKGKEAVQPAPTPPEEDKTQKDKQDYRGGPECQSRYTREEDLQMQKELYQLRQALEQERALRINTERRRRLEQLARFYALDVEEEMQLCQYGRMDDPAFERHLERIEKYYRPLPAEAQLPAWAEGDPAAEAPAAVSRQLYQRRKQEELSQKAVELARRMAQRGQWISYAEALQRVQTGQTA